MAKRKLSGAAAAAVAKKLAKMTGDVAGSAEAVEAIKGAASSTGKGMMAGMKGKWPWAIAAIFAYMALKK